MIHAEGSPPRQRRSSTDQRARPMPGAVSSVEGREAIRQRVTAAVGRASAASDAAFQRRTTKAVTPEASAASCSRREASNDI